MNFSKLHGHEKDHFGCQVPSFQWFPAARRSDAEAVMRAVEDLTLPLLVFSLETVDDLTVGQGGRIADGLALRDIA